MIKSNERRRKHPYHGHHDGAGANRPRIRKVRKVNASLSVLGIAASSPGLRATATATLEYSTERLEQELAACAAANIFEASCSGFFAPTLYLSVQARNRIALFLSLLKKIDHPRGERPKLVVCAALKPLELGFPQDSHLNVHIKQLRYLLRG